VPLLHGAKAAHEPGGDEQALRHGVLESWLAGHRSSFAPGSMATASATSRESTQTIAGATISAYMGDAFVKWLPTSKERAMEGKPAECEPLPEERAVEGKSVEGEPLSEERAMEGKSIAMEREGAGAQEAAGAGEAVSSKAPAAKGGSSKAAAAKAAVNGRRAQSRGGRGNRRGGQSRCYVAHHDALLLLGDAPQPLRMQLGGSHRVAACGIVAR